ncbi:unnamed protein product, partial [Brenthis ino]
MANGLANNLAYDGAAWSAQSYGAPFSASWATAPPSSPYATAEWSGYSPAGLSASYGGGLAVSSASPAAPTGVAISSQNAYEGALAVSGAMPYLGSTALEGALPTAGAGAVYYGCGNGNVGMLSEDLAGYNALGAYGYGPAELGYGYAPMSYEARPAYSSYGYGGYECGFY